MSYKPTKGMIAEAKKGLAWRREFGRGGTAVGIARARDLVNGKELPLETVKRMYSFFQDMRKTNKPKVLDLAKKVIRQIQGFPGRFGVETQVTHGQGK